MRNQIKLVLATILITATTSAVACMPLLVELSREAVDAANVTNSYAVQKCIKDIEAKHAVSASIHAIKTLDNSTYFFELGLLEGGDIMAGNAEIRVERSDEFPEWGPSYTCTLINSEIY